MAKYVYNSQGQMIQRKGILSGCGTVIAVVFAVVVLAGFVHSVALIVTIIIAAVVGGVLFSTLRNRRLSQRRKPPIRK